jgi:rhomboid family protein
MGIYDREYYREAPRGPGFFTGEWSACKVLIWANVGVYLIDWVLKGQLADAFGASEETILGRLEVYRLLTYAFIHSGPIHILFNMLFLWMAGREIETIYGKWEFLAFYLTAAVLGGLAWLGIELAATGSGRGMVGASGAVLAVLVVYAMYYPTREVLVFAILPMPMWLFVMVFVGINALGLMQQIDGDSSSMTAFSTHLGGAGYGFLYKYFDLRWSRMLTWPKRRPKLRVFSPESRERRVAPSVSSGRTGSAKSGVGASPAAPGAPMTRFPDEHLDAKVDEILAKIARDGRSALTEEENRILQEASIRARNRRGEHL